MNGYLGKEFQSAFQHGSIYVGIESDSVFENLVSETNHVQFSADSIIIYGKSMGTGIAAELASTTSCKRLILETPYYDFPAVIRHYLPIYPVRWMLHYQIPTYEYLQNVSAPITIFHGTSDMVVSYRNTNRLKPLLKTVDEVVTIEGGHHNDLYDFPLVVNKLDSLLRLP